MEKLASAQVRVVCPKGLGRNSLLCLSVPTVGTDAGWALQRRISIPGDCVLVVVDRLDISLEWSEWALMGIAGWGSGSVVQAVDLDEADPQTWDTMLRTGMRVMTVDCLYLS